MGNVYFELWNESTVGKAYKAPHIILQTCMVEGTDGETILANCTADAAILWGGDEPERVPAVYICEQRQDGGENWEGVCFNASMEDMSTVDDFMEYCREHTDDFTGYYEVVESVKFDD
ncbi:MAG: hypothetical protein LUD78_10050 [Clostridiales bacterium]|nr:hypothetical protein [Clostridiales bacterium]